MKLSMTLNYSGDPKRTAQTARDYESAGVDMVWVAELYSFDAVSLMGYLAAVTERMEIASGILPLYSRTPTLIGMTAAGMDAVSEGRFANNRVSMSLIPPYAAPNAILYVYVHEPLFGSLC